MHIQALAYKNFLAALTAEQRTDFARTKRFLERWSGDPDFRSRIDLADGSRELIREQLGFDFDVSELAPIIDVNAAGLTITVQDWPLAHLWQEYIRSATQFRNELRALGDSGGLTPAFDTWRTRQMNRAAFDLGVKAISIVHAPIVFELSDGCSVGCWFCGISADKFKGHFDARAEGAMELWRDVLRHSRELLGDGVGAGFCYWATDPMDNPSYCELADEFATAVGSYPQITTAIPLKDLVLTKRALRGTHGVQLFPNRFSVLTTGILRRIHQSFTADELLNVELVLQNKGALQDAKAVAGKARDKRKTIPIVTESDDSEAAPRGDSSGTIACVTGFLVNMVAKTIKLITPTSATEKTPNGYLILAEASFADADGFRQALDTIVAEHMNPKISTNRKIRFIDGLAVIRSGGVTEFSSLNFRARFPHSDELVDVINGGETTAKEIVKSFADREIDPLRTIYLIDSLWKGGLIETT